MHSLILFIWGCTDNYGDVISKIPRLEQFLQCIKYIINSTTNIKCEYVVKDQKCLYFIQNLKTLCPNHHRYHQDEKNNFDTEIWCEVDDEFQYNVAMPR